jgi:hypothetical protein
MAAWAEPARRERRISGAGHRRLNTPSLPAIRSRRSAYARKKPDREPVAMSTSLMNPRVAVALFCAVALAGCASIHATMLGTPRPAIAVEQVRVYQVPPGRYEEIARLDASSAIGFGTQGQSNAAINRLRREAAKLGADGVILLGVETVAPPVSMGVGAGSFGRHVGGSVGVGIPTAQKHAAGVAIHVIGE